jgi:preprotein translocase SecF subunit
VEHGGEATAGSVGVRVQNALGPLAGGDAAKVVIEKEDMVGPTVGRQLKWDAIEAAIYSIIFIIAYLWFRFELKFSVAAVIALLHDVTITLGLFALTGRQISLGVVAAVLTIIGYSLNDTIVVFDRLREDLKLYRGRGLSLLEIMNKCVNETLSRTLLTGVSTLMVVFILLIFGGQVINDFAFVLFVGIIVGTFSSVYIASPVVYYWQRLSIHRGRAIQLEEEGPASRHRRKALKRKDVFDEEVRT